MEDNNSVLNLNNDFDEIIYVEGSIIIKATQCQCVYMAASCDEEYKNIATEIIHGNLIIDEGFNKYSSFAYYIAKGDVIAYNDYSFPWRESVVDSFNAFEIDFQNLKKLLGIRTLDAELTPILHKVVWAHAFSLYESYIINILLTLFVSCPEEYFKTFRGKEFEKKRNHKQMNDLNILSKIVQEQNVRRVIRTIEYSNFDKIKKVFKSLFGIDLPSYTEISKYYKVRNDIMHRNGEEDPSGNKIVITQKDIEKVLSCVHEFIFNINILIRDFEKSKIQYLASQEGLF